MAHLTKYTFSSLCKKLEINKEIDLDMFINQIYNDKQIFFILNKVQIKFLFIFKMLLEDDDKFYKEYYRFVPPKKDTKSYVFEEERKLKYHLDYACPLIHKDFIDFIVPPELKDLGNDVVEDYRNWFKSKGYAESYFQGHWDASIVVFTYNLKFPEKYNVPHLNPSYKLIEERPNSSTTEKNSQFNKDLFITTIEELKKQFYHIFPCKVSRTLSKFDYMLTKTDAEIVEKLKEVFCEDFPTNYGIANFKKMASLAGKIKNNIILNLLEYFKWTYNLNENEKEFNIVALEHFGLECCKKCSGNQQIIKKEDLF